MSKVGYEMINDSGPAPKKTVHYSSAIQIKVGSPAYVFPIDHPDAVNVSNKKMVLTTPVLAYNEHTGIFITMNTIYVRNK
jgi:hypothetical protein